MNTINLLQNLHIFNIFLKELRDKESTMHTDTSGSSDKLKMQLICSYSFVYLKLFLPDDILYSSITFELNSTTIVLKEVYCEDKNRANELHAFILQSGITQMKWGEVSKTTVNSDSSIAEYLGIADSIAGKTFNCCNGDHYSPGLYSKIILTEKELVLEQINHMNSRSRNHKEDYSLRSLEMHLPIQDGEDSMQCDYQIGILKILFRDNSSKNHKHCEEALVAEIEEQKKCLRSGIHNFLFFESLYIYALACIFSRQQYHNIRFVNTRTEASKSQHQFLK